MGLNGGINLYAYAPNPLGWIDPLGLNTEPTLPPGTIIKDGGVTIEHYYHGSDHLPAQGKIIRSTLFVLNNSHFMFKI
ncbi:hypothetical protein [Escherichia coli]|uniref:hypothetical protein n=1 Tax=Escherichia coli TaxID=562 RepID=UPI00210E5A74